MKKQDKEMPDTNLHDISEELKTQLDEYLERVTGSYCISEEKSDREYTVDQEAIAGILDCTLKDGIYQTFYSDHLFRAGRCCAFNKITQYIEWILI